MTEAESQKMTQDALVSMARQANKAIFYRSVAIIAVVILGVTAWFAASQYQGAQDAAREAAKAASIVREAAVANCERSVKSGGVRRIVADTIKDQISQQRQAHYRDFFPNVPAKTLTKLKRKSIRHERQQIQNLLSVDCVAQYPRV